MFLWLFGLPNRKYLEGNKNDFFIKLVIFLFFVQSQDLIY